MSPVELSHVLLAQANFSFFAALNLNIIKFVPMVLVYLLWVYTVAWVDHENREHAILYMQRVFWNNVLFWSGVGGILIMFAIPELQTMTQPLRWALWFVKFLLQLTLYIVPTWLYISTRNRHVPMDDAITLQTLYADTLALLGIRVRRKRKKRGLGPPIHFVTSGGAKYEMEQPAAEDPAVATAMVEAWVATKTLVYDAIKRRATDVFMEPRGQQYAVVYKIDGVLMAGEPLDLATGMQVIRNIKSIAGLNPNEMRKPQSGEFVAVIKNAESPVKVETRGTRAGERLHMQLYVEAAHPETLEELGMRPQHVEQLKEVVARRAGVVLVGGPPESGKTTTGHALLRAVDRYMRNVVTLEDDFEYKIETVTRSKVDPEKGETPFTKLRSIVRTEPDVVYVDELHEPEQAQLIAKAAMERLFIVTLTANDAISTICRWRDLVGDPQLAAAPLLAVVSPRLVRKLCEACKEPYQPNPQLLQRLNIPAGRVQYFYKPPEPPAKPEEICSQCYGLGYYGRTGVFEVLIVNDALRQAIAAGLDPSRLRNEARKAGLIYHQEDALRQVILGVTSLQEIRRAFTETTAPTQQVRPQAPTRG